MGSIYKFKTLKEARTFGEKEFFEKGFDYEKAKEFFGKYFKATRDPTYKPGIYKFRTFKEAREFDLKKIIERS